MFIIELIKAFRNKEEKKELPVTVHTIRFEKLPEKTQDWIKRCYNKKNGIKEED